MFDSKFQPMFPSDQSNLPPWASLINSVAMATVFLQRDNFSGLKC